MKSTCDETKKKGGTEEENPDVYDFIISGTLQS